MRYYYNLHDFYKKVDIRCEISQDVELPKLYSATPTLDNLYATGSSGLWLLEKQKFVKGKYEYDADFKTKEDAERELAQQFYEAVANKMYNL